MKRNVKIVAASDLHGARLVPLGDEVIRLKPDVFVIAGDLQGGGYGGREYFEREFIPMVRLLNSYGIETVLVPGNHDFYLHDLFRRKFVPRGYHLLIDQEETICGLRFYGTPWCPFINGKWVFEFQDAVIGQWFQKIPFGLDVLVSHSPPKGVGDENFDVSMQFKPEYRQHFGSESLRRRIFEVKPRLVLCGHIHSGDHKPYTYKQDNVTIANVSLLDERYNRAYGMARMTVMPGRKLRFTPGRKLYD